jgi:predicted permease
LRQLLTESLLLALAGCAAGLVVSYWASRGIVFVVFRHPTGPFLAMFRPSLAVFGFGAAIAILGAILFGLVPALTSSRITPGATLKAAGGSISDAERRNRLGRTLVAAEVAVALILVIGAGLFLRTLIRLETLDPGLRVDRVLTVSISPTSARIPEDRVPALVQDLTNRLGALPGVESASWASDVLLSGDLWTTGVKLQERPDAGDLETQAIAIGPKFFETLRIPVLAGRSVVFADCRKDAPLVWVNKSFVDRFLKNSNPIGMHILRNKKLSEIVGVVGDTKFESMKSQFSPSIFIPDGGGDGYFHLRTSADPELLQNSVRNLFSEAVPNLPIITMQPLRQSIDDDLSGENAMARLSTAFGLLALVLAAIGVYGVLAYSVARRTSEIAIRMSLGAMPANILRLILAEGLRPAIAGALTGLLASWGLTRLVAQFLYEVKPLDPVTFAGATIVLISIAALACYIPARRAMRVAPMIALRYE